MILNHLNENRGKVFIACIVLVLLQACSNDESRNREEKAVVHQSPLVTINENSITGLAYNKRLLESYPFNLSFNNGVSSEDDTTSYIGAKSSDRLIEAKIHFNPKDNEFYFIEFTRNNVPPHPSKSDYQILLDFTDKFDTGFENFFHRNLDGILIDENKFVDEGRYLNREKGFCFITEGDVAYNNQALKEHPDEKEQILEAGNFLSITVVNIRKPSWLFHDFNNWTTIEK